MFGIQEQALNTLLASLKNGEQTGPEAQRHLVRLAALSQNNPTAPVPTILNWFHFSCERARRMGRPNHNILRITAIILSTIFGGSRVSYGEDCEGGVMDVINMILQFYSNYVNQATEHASLRQTGLGLASSVAHLCLELFIEKLRQLFDSPSLKPNLHEVLIASLSDIKLGIHPERNFELTMRLLSSLGKRFGQVNSTSTKKVYCETISALLLPLIPDIGAESNIPEWTQLIETIIWPRADALYGKPRFAQLSVTLITALLCVSRSDFFLQHQANFITSLVHRIKSKDITTDHLLSVLQLWWVYCFRHADSLSTLSQQSERLHDKLFFSPRNKFPEITPMMQCHFLWMSLTKLTKHAILKQVIPILTSTINSLTATMPRTTGSSLGSIGSALMSSLSFSNLLPETIALERAIQAITAYMVFLTGRRPEFPTLLAPPNFDLITTIPEDLEHKSLCVSIARLLLALDKHIRSEASNKSVELFILILKCMPVLLHQDSLSVITRWIVNGSHRALAGEALNALLRCIAMHNEQLSALIHAQLLLLLSKTPCTSYSLLESVLVAMRALLRHQSFSPIDTVSVLSVHLLSSNTVVNQLAVECLELVRSFIPSDSHDKALAQLYSEIPNTSPRVQSFLDAPTIAAMIKPALFRFMQELAGRFERARDDNHQEGNARDIHTAVINQWQRYASFFCCNGALTATFGTRSTFSTPMDVINLVFRPYITHHSGRVREAAIDAMLDLHPSSVEPFLREVWSPLTTPACSDFINPRFKFLKKNGITVMRKGDLLKVDLTHTLHNLILAHLPTSVGLIIKYVVELWYFCIEIDRDNQLPQLRYWACKTLSAFVNRIRGCWESGLLPARLHTDVWSTIYKWSKGMPTGSEGGDAGMRGIVTRSVSADSLARSTLMTQSSLSFSSVHQEQTQVLHDSLLALSYRLPVKDFIQLFEWLDTLNETLTEAVCNLLYNRSIHDTLLQMVIERAYGEGNALGYARALFEAVYRDILEVHFSVLIILAFYHNDAQLTRMLTQRSFTSITHLSMILADGEGCGVSERVILEGCKRLRDVGVLFPWISNLIVIEDMPSLLHALLARSTTMSIEVCRVWQQWCLWGHHLTDVICFLLNETDRTEFIEAMALVEPQPVTRQLVALTQYKYWSVASKALKWFDALMGIHGPDLTAQELDAIEYAKYVIRDNDFPRNAGIALDWALGSEIGAVRDKSWIAYRSIREYGEEDFRRILDGFDGAEDEMIQTIADMLDSGLFDARVLELGQHPLIVATLIRNDRIEAVMHLDHPRIVFALLEKTRDVQGNAIPFLMICLPELLRSPAKCKLFAQWIRDNHQIASTDDPLSDPIMELASLIPRLSLLQDLPATLSSVLLDIGDPETVLSHLHHSNQAFQVKFLQHFLPSIKTPFSPQLIAQVSGLAETFLASPAEHDSDAVISCITAFLSKQQ